MGTVVVIAVGGTIASTGDSHGVKTATVAADLLTEAVQPPAGVGLRTVAAATVNSFAMTFATIDAVRDAVGQALADPETIGVVVTHGTDTLEETAFAVHLTQPDPRPVVFTGAQRSWDDPHTDAVANLRDAVLVAASPAADSSGALVCFDGRLYAATGVRKVHTSAPAAFDDPDHGVVGTVCDGQVDVTRRPGRPHPAFAANIRLAGTRVDTVAVYPGVDRTAMDAFADAGADGIVLAATGCGNATPEIVDAVGDLARSGVPTVVSTRVAGGATAPVYGGGGGADLVAAGAIGAGMLMPSQARILLAALVATGVDPDMIADTFEHYHVDPTETSTPRQESLT